MLVEQFTLVSWSFFHNKRKRTAAVRCICLGGGGIHLNYNFFNEILNMGDMPQGCHLAFFVTVPDIKWFGHLLAFSNVDKNSIFEGLFWTKLSKFQTFYEIVIVILTIFWRKFGLYLAAFFHILLNFFWTWQPWYAFLALLASHKVSWELKNFVSQNNYTIWENLICDNVRPATTQTWQLNLWYTTSRVRSYTVNMRYPTCRICDSKRHVVVFRRETVVLQDSNK